MEIQHYKDFLKYQDLGLKQQASESVKAFVTSFRDEAEIQDWVWLNLPNLHSSRHSRIRHEIFIGLVYPVLKKGYEVRDFDSMLWLGKLIQNVNNNFSLDKELDFISDTELFRECHKLKPEDQETRTLLLNNLIQGLEYSVHEWPAGILVGNNGATIDECKLIREKLEFVRKLDVENNYCAFLKDFECKLEQYESRLCD